MAVAGLERTEIVKGSTHLDCSVETLKEHTSIYEGGDRDQLMGPNTASVRHIWRERKRICTCERDPDRLVRKVHRLKVGSRITGPETPRKMWHSFESIERRL